MPVQQEKAASAAAAPPPKAAAARTSSANGGSPPALSWTETNLAERYSVFDLVGKQGRRLFLFRHKERVTAGTNPGVGSDGGMPQNGGGGRVHPADMGPPPGGPPVDAKALANKMKSRKTALKFLNELMLYLIWTMCFTATIMLTRDNTQNHQVHLSNCGPLVSQL